MIFFSCISFRVLIVVSDRDKPYKIRYMIVQYRCKHGQKHGISKGNHMPFSRRGYHSCDLLAVIRRFQETQKEQGVVAERLGMC